MNQKKVVVISGINIVDAGPLSVMKDFLQEVSKSDDKTLEVIALVNSKSQFEFFNIKYLEFPKSKKSWFYRLYYEYYYFKKLSKQLNVTHWISMHDMTPNVDCENLYVYCHNATPYYIPTWKDWLYGGRASLFSMLYIYLYGINIKKNKGIIVQQDWLRKKFQKKFKHKNIIVAYPDVTIKEVEVSSMNQFAEEGTKKLFFPSFPRSFKNFEVICEAYEKLPNDYKVQLEVYLTLDKELNSYAGYIYKKYKHLKGLHFIGLIDREKVFEYYQKVDALVFPSKLESWGLPITEFKQFRKPIFLSDLPYAKETLGAYDKGYFFRSSDSSQLAELMTLLVDEKLPPTNNKECNVETPFFVGWKALFNSIINNENT